MTDELTDELIEDPLSLGSTFAYASLCRTTLLYSRVYTNRTTLLASLAGGLGFGSERRNAAGNSPTLARPYDMLTGGILAPFAVPFLVRTPRHSFRSTCRSNRSAETDSCQAVVDERFLIPMYCTNSTNSAGVADDKKFWVGDSGAGLDYDDNPTKAAARRPPTQWSRRQH